MGALADCLWQHKQKKHAIVRPHCLACQFFANGRSAAEASMAAENSHLALKTRAEELRKILNDESALDLFKILRLGNAVLCSCRRQEGCSETGLWVWSEEHGVCQINAIAQVSTFLCWL